MITSPSNPLVKEVVRLRKRRHRDASGRFVIEGIRPVERAIAAGVEIIHQITCPELADRELATTQSLVEMAEAPFRKASMLQTPDGVMAIASQLDTGLDRLVPTGASLVVVLEAIEKPGNLGAVLRTAEAVGVDAVVATDPSTDVHNPSVVRASQGALFTVPVAVASTDDALEWMRLHGLRLLATSPPAPSAISLWETDLRGPVAVAIGSEAAGLGPRLMTEAAARISIPMRGSTDSLNASVAAAVILYEARRQRQG